MTTTASLPTPHAYVNGLPVFTSKQVEAFDDDDDFPFIHAYDGNPGVWYLATDCQ